MIDDSRLESFNRQHSPSPKREMLILSSFLNSFQGEVFGHMLKCYSISDLIMKSLQEIVFGANGFCLMLMKKTKTNLLV